MEKEREAAEKKAEAQRKKALKPGEAQKGIVVDIDTKLLEAPFGGFLLQEIQNLGVRNSVVCPRPSVRLSVRSSIVPTLTDKNTAHVY